MQIIDNLLTKTSEDELNRMLTSGNFPWYYNNFTAYLSDDITNEKVKDTPQFVHGFFFDKKVNSDYYRYVIHIVALLENRLKIKLMDKLFRIKSNLLYKTNDYPIDCYHVPHIDHFDTNKKFNTFLYYVNDSDGDTIIFNEKANNNDLTIANRVTPKKGTGIFFDSSYLHASTPPRISENRIVINFVFVE